MRKRYRNTSKVDSLLNKEKSELDLLRTLVDNAPDIIARFDKNFRHIYVNKAVEEITGLSTDVFIGKTNEELGMPEHLCRVWNDILKKIFNTARPEALGFDFQTPEGMKSFQMRGVPECDAEGKVVSVLVVTRDITKQKQSENELRSANERLRYLLTSINAVVYTARTTGNYPATFVSTNVETMIGYARNKFIDDPDFWYMHIHPDDRDRITQVIAKLFTEGSYTHEYRFRTKNGNYIWVRDEMRLVTDESGNPMEIVGFLTDISDLKKIEQTLEYSEERFRLAQKVANIGSWDWDVTTGDLVWSETIEPLFGFKKGEFTKTYEAFLDCVHPDDRAEVVKAVDECLYRKSNYDIEHRIVWPDGTVRWMQETGNVIRDEKGKPVRMLGIVQDITQYKKEDAQRVVDAREQGAIDELENIIELFDTISNGLVVTDKGGIVRFINRRAESILKLRVGHKMTALFEQPLLCSKNIENAILYSKTLSSHFLVTRQKFKRLYIFMFEQLEKEIKRSRKIQSELAPYTFDDIIGLEDVKRRARLLAAQNVNVLLLGESGTGKELLASAIHNASPRAGNPYVVINCSAIPDTLFESEFFGYKKGAFTDARTDRMGKIEYAKGGTVFLDEIGDIPNHIQSKLLRIIEDKIVLPLGETKPRKVDVRFIFATNRNLEEMVKQRTFREDLYYRINAPALRIPSLRDRKQELGALIDHTMAKLEAIHKKFTSGLSKKARKQLMTYDYPGNVRELEGLLKNAYLTSQGEEIEIEDVRTESLSKESVNEKVKRHKAQLVFECYLSNAKDIEKTAKILGLSPRQVYRYLKIAR